MAEWHVTASVSGPAVSGLIRVARFEPIAVKLVFKTPLLLRTALKGQCGKQAGKFTCCAVGKSIYSGIVPSWSGRPMAGDS